MDLHEIFETQFQSLSPIFQACFLANEHKVLELIAATTPDSEERTALLESRISQMRFTPLISCITAENTIQITDPKTGAAAPQTETRTRIIRALIEAGARIDAKDVAGHRCMNFVSLLTVLPLPTMFLTLLSPPVVPCTIVPRNHKGGFRHGFGIQ